MQNISETRRKINDFCRNSGKYHPDAYEFITAAVIEQVNSLPQARHLTAREILVNLKKQLTNKFGFLAGEVLKSWQISNADDIGEIVFDLIKINILSASEDDKLSDFQLDLPLFEAVLLRKIDSKSEIPKID